MIEDALYAFLTTAPRATFGVIGNRLYPNLIPQEIDQTAIAFQTITTSERGLDHGGPAGYARKRIQFSCQAKRPSQARAAAAAIVADLHGFRGQIGPHTVHYASVNGDSATNDLFDAAVCRVDLEILFKE